MAEQQSEINSGDTRWSVLKKAAFLFVATYAVLNILPFPAQVVVWVGHQFLNLKELTEISRTGSGDTTYDYVMLLTLFCFSVVLASAILVIDWRRDNYRKFIYYFFAGLRYYIAFIMLGYGCAKIFQGQFRFPSLDALDRSYGDSSPMGLLWTFMGYSKSYTVFSGLAEIIGGTLLLWRQTTTLGGIIVTGVMTNVLMLNLCYDVPVKIYSAHILFFTLIILSADAKALWYFFILHKQSSASDYYLPPMSDQVKTGYRIVKPIVVFLLLAYMLVSDYQILNRGDKQAHPLYGIYTVKTFRTSREIPSGWGFDSISWNKLILDKEYAKVLTSFGRPKYYGIGVDSVQKKIIFTSFRDSTDRHFFTYRDSGASLLLSGVWQKDTIEVTLVKTDHKFILATRGFHWINEYPYNR